MRDTSPLGHTSFRRTATDATGLSTREFKFNLGLAHDIHVGFEGGGIEGDGLRIIIFLVAGKFGAEPDDAVFAAIAAGCLP